MNREHVQSAAPKPVSKGGQLDQFKEALVDAENRMAWIESSVHGSHRELALRGQRLIVQQWRRQIADLTSEDWLT